MSPAPVAIGAHSAPAEVGRDHREVVLEDAQTPTRKRRKWANLHDMGGSPTPRHARGVGPRRATSRANTCPSDPGAVAQLVLRAGQRARWQGAHCGCEHVHASPGLGLLSTAADKPQGVPAQHKVLMAYKPCQRLQDPRSRHRTQNERRQYKSTRTRQPTIVLVTI